MDIHRRLKENDADPQPTEWMQLESARRCIPHEFIINLLGFITLSGG